MAINTIDVVTSLVSGVDFSKNGISVVYCSRTGLSQNNYPSSTYEAGINYAEYESKYTNRFDDVTYYTIGNEILVGG